MSVVTCRCRSATSVLQDRNWACCAPERAGLMLSAVRSEMPAVVDGNHEVCAVPGGVCEPRRNPRRPRPPASGCIWGFAVVGRPRQHLDLVAQAVRRAQRDRVAGQAATRCRAVAPDTEDDHPPRRRPPRPKRRQPVGRVDQPRRSRGRNRPNQQNVDAAVGADRGRHRTTAGARRSRRDRPGPGVFHGHWHQPNRCRLHNGTDVIGLAADGHPQSAAVPRVSDLQADYINPLQRPVTRHDTH